MTGDTKYASNEIGEIQFVNETGMPLSIYLKPICTANTKRSIALDYGWAGKRTKPDYVLIPRESVFVKVAVDKGIAYSAQTEPNTVADRMFKNEGRVFFSDENRTVVLR